MIYDNPHGKVEIREPANAGQPPAPPAPWGFNEVKLRRLIEASHRAHLAKVDLGERVREAKAAVVRLRSAIDSGKVDRGAPGRPVHAEAEHARLAAEYKALVEASASTIATAGACESWARSRGWAPDGRPGAPVLPRVGDSTPARSPLLDHWSA